MRPSTAHLLPNCYPDSDSRFTLVSVAFVCSGVESTVCTAPRLWAKRREKKKKNDSCREPESFVRRSETVLKFFFYYFYISRVAILETNIFSPFTNPLQFRAHSGNCRTWTGFEWGIWLRCLPLINWVLFDKEKLSCWLTGLRLIVGWRSKVISGWLSEHQSPALSRWSSIELCRLQTVSTSLSENSLNVLCVERNIDDKSLISNVFRLLQNEQKSIFKLSRKWRRIPW